MSGRAHADPGSKASSPTDQQKNQIDFQFLNFSHPADAKASGARKTVRSHVTKQQHQREHAAAAARKAQNQPQQQPAVASSSAAAAAAGIPSRPLRLERPGPSRATTGSPEASSASPSPTGSPLESHIDPTDIFPDELHPYLPRIVDYYLSNVAVDIPALDGPDAKGLLRTRFFPFCFTDRASLHAMMLMAAAHYDNVHDPRSHAINLLQLRGLAIGEINGALEDPARATSDQLIAAVANVASYEVLFGDRSIFNTHMTGLLRMVTLRGGLAALGLDGLLERMLLWIDVNAAHIAGSHIYFDKAAFPSTARHPRPNPRLFAGASSGEPPTA